MRKTRRGAVMILSVYFAALSDASARTISLSPHEIERFGERIYENECASKDEYLVQWNQGEDFLSCGIGHFIWYPEGERGPFDESFPEFLSFVRSRGARAPSWLDAAAIFCPWKSGDDLERGQDDEKLAELKAFLRETKSLQAEFIVDRFNNSLRFLSENALSENTRRIDRQVERLMQTPAGVFAMVDYANFKGFGLLASEQYQGKGWGLFQVLSEMRVEEEEPDALKEFVDAANRVLVERVYHSPRTRREHRWLPGWQKRVNRYLEN